MTSIAFALIFVLIFVLCGQFVGQLFYTYRVRPDGIVILLFRLIPVWRFALTRIISIRVVRGREKWRILNPFTTLRLGNRLFGPAVLVEVTRGFTGLRAILLTPDDADSFVREVNAARELACARR